jgi:hypothetical protein
LFTLVIAPPTVLTFEIAPATVVTLDMLFPTVVMLFPEPVVTAVAIEPKSSE